MINQINLNYECWLNIKLDSTLDEEKQKNNSSINVIRTDPNLLKNRWIIQCYKYKQKTFQNKSSIVNYITHIKIQILVFVNQIGFELYLIDKQVYVLSFLDKELVVE